MNKHFKFKKEPIKTPTCFAFTSKYDGLSNKLKNESRIIYNGKEITVPALWDTGATNTCIADEIAEGLSIPPTGKAEIHTPSGCKTVSTYLISINLPNNVNVNDVSVTGTDIWAQGIGLLIGMDIISLGDFAVSNYAGKTIFSFRIPSKKKTDYVVENKINNCIGNKHGIKRTSHK